MKGQKWYGPNRSRRYKRQGSLPGSGRSSGEGNGNPLRYACLENPTEELHKKDLHDPDNHDGVITHLEADILECEVKWALESITTNKAGGGDGIPVELFQILKDDAVKVRHSICQQIWKTQQWPQDWKSQFSFLFQRRQCQRMLKLLHNCTHLTC